MANSNPDIVGVDFSGAKDAGRHIWMSTGKESQGSLQITNCEPASDFFGVSTNRDVVLDQLVTYVDSLDDTTVGMDFPFGVPEEVAQVVFKASTWLELVNSPQWSRLNPKQFRQQSSNLVKGGVRDTDAMHRGSSPYDIRIHKQTYYGIRDVLKPLVKRNVSVAPMVNNGSPTVLETYPAATLAREDGMFGRRYKNDKSPSRRMSHNFDELAKVGDLDLSSVSKNRITDNVEGDAIDSLVAALATFRASNNSSLFNTTQKTRVEGRIYS